MTRPFLGHPGNSDSGPWLAAEIARRDAETARVLQAELARRRERIVATAGQSAVPAARAATSPRGWLATTVAEREAAEAVVRARSSAQLVAAHD